MKGAILVAISVAVAMAAGCGGLWNRHCTLCDEALTPARMDFTGTEVGRVPEGFITAMTHDGQPGEWAVVEDDGTKVLAQMSMDTTKDRYPLCLYMGRAAAADIAITARFKAMAGTVDQAAGLVVRYRNRNNYYVARANALENNVRLYKVEGGERVQLASADVKVTSGEWHTLNLEAVGPQLGVYYDSNKVIGTSDTTFSQAGLAGLWTKADSVTFFKAVTVEFPEQVQAGQP
jgi:hypothetical protein